jgi:hypothetical protein
MIANREKDPTDNNATVIAKLRAATDQLIDIDADGAGNLQSVIEKLEAIIRKLTSAD